MRALERWARAGSSVQRVTKARVSLVRICDELAALLEAGLPLQAALDVALAGNQHERTDRTLLQLAKDGLERGMSLSEVWEGRVPALFFCLLRGGEQSGSLVFVLKSWSQKESRERDWRRQFAKMVGYPAVLTLLTGLLLVFLGTVVLPMFTRMYMQFGAAGTSDAARVERILRLLPLVLTAGLVLITVLGFALWVVRENFSETWKRVKLRLPFWRLVRTRRTNNLAMLLSMLLLAGVPVSEALSAVEGSHKAGWLSRAASEIHLRIMDGERLSEAFRGEWDPVLVTLVGWAEQTGELAEAFVRCEKYTNELFRGRVERLLAALEPTLLAVMGGLIAFTMASVFLPMYDLISHIAGGT